jgi:hypothetical protein
LPWDVGIRYHSFLSPWSVELLLFLEISDICPSVGISDNYLSGYLKQWCLQTQTRSGILIISLLSWCRSNHTFRSG